LGWAKVKSLLDDDQEEEQRTTPQGLFTFAESYSQAANHLQDADLKTPHPSLPVNFLYYHAIELYLKAFLRLHGHTLKELRNLSHSTRDLQTRSQQLGLLFDEATTETFSLMAANPAILFRYVRTGGYRWPTHDSLNRTCENLRQSIGDELRKSGVYVRLF
jgi:hypothetical protein